MKWEGTGGAFVQIVHTSEWIEKERETDTEHWDWDWDYDRDRDSRPRCVLELPGSWSNRLPMYVCGADISGCVSGWWMTRKMYCQTVKILYNQLTLPSIWALPATLSVWKKPFSAQQCMTLKVVQFLCHEAGSGPQQSKYSPAAS